MHPFNESIHLRFDLRKRSESLHRKLGINRLLCVRANTIVQPSERISLFTNGVFMNFHYTIFRYFTLMLFMSVSTLYSQPRWEPTDGPYGGRIFALHVLGNQHVLAGTSDGGVYRSTDDGRTWKYDGLAMSTVRTIIESSNGRIFAGLQQGLMISSDNGSTWNNTQVQHSGFGLAANASGHIYIGGWGEMSRSTDDGATWNSVGMGITSPYIDELLITNTGTILAGLYPNAGVNNGGLYRSTDNGTTWQLADARFGGSGVEAIVQRGTTIYASSNQNGVARSTDDGATWTFPSSTLNATNIVSLLFLDDRNAIAGNGVGHLLRSSDAGEMWTIAFSLPGQPSIFSLDRLNSGTLLAGTNFGGIYRSTDNGSTWTLSSDGLTSIEPASMAINSKGEVHASFSISGNQGAIQKTSDQGQSWTEIQNPPSGASLLAFGPSDELYVMSYAGGPFYTVDNGATWTSDSVGAPRIYYSAFAVSRQRDIAVGGYSGELYLRRAGETQWLNLTGKAGSSQIFSLSFIGSTLFVCTGNNGLHRTKDKGVTFEKLTNGMNELSVTLIKENPGDGLYIGTFGSVFRSTDSGDSWSRLPNPPSGLISGIAFPNSKSIFVAVQYRSISYMHTGGTTWETINDGLPNLIMKHLFSTPSGALIVSTKGNGLFRMLSPPVSVGRSESIPGTLALHQNHPNPFRAETALRYDVERGMHVRLTIHDLLGREVALLREDFHAPGEYSASFNGDALPNGMYLVRMVTPFGTKTRTMIHSK